MIVLMLGGINNEDFPIRYLLAMSCTFVGTCTFNTNLFLYKLVCVPPTHIRWMIRLLSVSVYRSRALLGTSHL